MHISIHTFVHKYPDDDDDDDDNDDDGSLVEALLPSKECSPLLLSSSCLEAASHKLCEY